MKKTKDNGLKSELAQLGSRCDASSPRGGITAQFLKAYYDRAVRTVELDKSKAEERELAELKKSAADLAFPAPEGMSRFERAEHTFSLQPTAFTFSEKVESLPQIVESLSARRERQAQVSVDGETTEGSDGCNRRQ